MSYQTFDNTGQKQNTEHRGDALAIKGVSRVMGHLGEGAMLPAITATLVTARIAQLRPDLIESLTTLDEQGRMLIEGIAESFIKAMDAP